MSKIGKGDQEVHTTGHKINKSQGCHVQHREYSQKYYNNFAWCIMCKNIETLCCTPKTNIIL